ncbi:MAG: hypothetical protein ACXWUG_19960 [Polyangiales bacterium]
MKRALALAAALLVATPSSAGLDPLQDASDAITTMELDKAQGILSKLDANDPKVAYQLGLLAFYKGDCDEANKQLSPQKVQTLKGAEGLLEIVRGCVRATASAVTVTDEVHHVVVRFQDEADAALASIIGETVDKQREVLKKDLGVEMPLPTRVEIVRDQFTLAAMTGLPHKAAQTTGTVGIAKFGRVVVLSPRAPELGYDWRDAIAHELTHLALARGTYDRAPLWLQEGVAKREEAKWRAALPTDEALSPDAIAAAGIAKKIALPLDKLGPSIALLPSPQQAMVAYAEVQSFVRFISGDRAGEPGAVTDKDMLAKIVKAYGRGLDTDKALLESTGKDLAGWDAVWRPWVEKRTAKLPETLGLDVVEMPKEAMKAKQKAYREANRALRIGELLLGRDHVAAAREKLDPLASHAGEPLVGAWIGRARLAAGDAASALAILDTKGLMGDVGLWWSARADALRATGAAPAEVVGAYLVAIGHDPFSVEGACGLSDPPASAPAFDGWLDAAAKGLCATAKARQLPKMGQD